MLWLFKNPFSNRDQVWFSLNFTLGRIFMREQYLEDLVISVFLKHRETGGRSFKLGLEEERLL